MAKAGLKLEARPQPSKAWGYGSPVLALLVTVLIGIVLFMALGKDPVRGLLVFFWEPIKSGYALGELVVKATPLLLIALGLAVCFRSNVWNIGAEGQYIIGAVAASGVALLAEKNHWGLDCGARGDSGHCRGAWPGPGSPPSCATNSTPMRSWSA